MALLLRVCSTLPAVDSRNELVLFMMRNLSSLKGTVYLLSFVLIRPRSLPLGSNVVESRIRCGYQCWSADTQGGGCAPGTRVVRLAGISSHNTSSFLQEQGANYPVAIYATVHLSALSPALQPQIRVLINQLATHAITASLEPPLLGI